MREKSLAFAKQQNIYWMVDEWNRTSRIYCQSQIVFYSQPLSVPFPPFYIHSFLRICRFSIPSPLFSSVSRSMGKCECVKQALAMLEWRLLVSHSRISMRKYRDPKYYNFQWRKAFCRYSLCWVCMDVVYYASHNLCFHMNGQPPSHSYPSPATHILTRHFFFHETQACPFCAWFAQMATY